ncbi:hypothetical protein BGW42_001673 [Actinomortierella wolfii]|nr:hypothetical protein BGW42_001673 [Actinomortierella wolfii]
MTNPTKYPFYQVDVFSKKPYYGNPLAVVVALDPSLPVPTTEEMARFANWTNLSETTFLLPPTDPTKADYRARIFTPRGELPFAGHPTLGTCSVFLNHLGSDAEKGKPYEQPRKVVQECGVGLVELRANSPTEIAFAAPPLMKEGSVEASVVQIVCKSMGIDPEKDVIDSQWITNGPAWFALLLKDVDTVLRAKSIMTEESKPYEFGIIGKYPSDTVKKPDDPLFEVRAFPHADLIEEDPVTGSFNAGMAQWLIGNGVAPPKYVASQGTAMGRGGRVLVERDDSDASVPEGERKIWIGGEKLIVSIGFIWRSDIESSALDLLYKVTIFAILNHIYLIQRDDVSSSLFVALGDKLWHALHAPSLDDLMDAKTVESLFDVTVRLATLCYQDDRKLARNWDGDEAIGEVLSALTKSSVLWDANRAQDNEATDTKKRNDSFLEAYCTHLPNAHAHW